MFLFVSLKPLGEIWTFVSTAWAFAPNVRRAFFTPLCVSLSRKIEVGGHVRL